MAENTSRSVSLERLETGVYRATNARGGTLDFGSSAGDAFTPVELLLAAIGGCSAVDVDVVTTRRAQPDRFTVTVQAQAVRDRDGNRLQDVEVIFDLAFPDDPAGARAAAIVPQAIRASHDRSCTVSRSLELGTPVRMDVRLPPGPDPTGTAAG